MSPEQLLSHLAAAMNLPALAFDNNGCARLVVDGKTAVNFEVDAGSGKLQLYNTLCRLPLEGRETLFLSLLEGNLFCAQTHGATLAVDTLYNEVLLCRAVTCEDTDGPAFVRVVEAFVAGAEDWAERVGAGTLRGAGSGTPPPETAEPRLQAHFLRV